MEPCEFYTSVHVLVDSYQCGPDPPPHDCFTCLIQLLRPCAFHGGYGVGIGSNFATTRLMLWHWAEFIFSADKCFFEVGLIGACMLFSAACAPHTIAHSIEAIALKRVQVYGGRRASSTCSTRAGPWLSPMIASAPAIAVIASYKM